MTVATTSGENAVMLFLSLPLTLNGHFSAPMIDMSFDIIQFNGGLMVAGVPSKVVHGIQRYKINHFHDLTSLLGSHWHFRGLNKNGDDGYVVLETVEYYLHKRRPLVEYLPPQPPAENITDISIERGYALAFSFVCGYGTKSTFGKDRKICFEYV